MTWPKVMLREVCEIIMGQAPSGESYNENGEGYPLIAGAGDFKNGVITPKKYTTAPTKLSQKDDIVMSIRASIGDKVWCEENFCLGRGVSALRPKKDLDKKYLWHALTEVEKDLIRKGRGATFLQVSKDDIKDLIILLPPLAEQQRIAAILDQAELIKRNRELAIEKLDELAQSIFIEMFGDSITNNLGWESKSLGEIADFYAGNSLPKESAYKNQNDGYFLMKVSDMNSLGNEREIMSCKSWSDLAGAKSATCPKGSIVIPKRGGAIGTNKKRITTRPTVLDPNLMAIKPKEDIVLTEYLFQWFLNFDLLSITNGSSVPQLNKKDLDPLRIQIPAIKAQEKFRNFIELHLAHKAKNINLMKRETMLIDSIKHQVFSGQL